MKCIAKVAACSIALLAFSAISIRETAAVQITLNLVQADSSMTLTGFFGGQPFLAQDGQAGTTDFNPASPSNRTTYQGTITIDVDNPLFPTSIQLVSSAANADVSGKWLPEMEPFLDVDGDLNFGEFPDDAVTSVGTTPGGRNGAVDGDHGFRINPGAPAAWGAYRDVEFNIRTLDNLNNPSFVPVNPLNGEFSSVTENFEYTTGWFDYWLHPTFTAEKLRQRLELAGGDDDNALAAVSKFELLPLGGGLSLMKLTIPINYDIPDPTAPTKHTGQFVATLIVPDNIPEPTSFVLLSLGGIACLGVRRRK